MVSNRSVSLFGFAFSLSVDSGRGVVPVVEIEAVKANLTIGEDSRRKRGRHEGARSTSQWNNSFLWRVLKQRCRRFGKGDERRGGLVFEQRVG